MKADEWGGSYPKPTMYLTLAKALTAAGHDVEGVSMQLAKLS